MSKKPLYIDLLTHLNSAPGDEWVDLAAIYRSKLDNPAFFNEFKEEVEFLSGNKDIITKGNLSENPEASTLQLSAQITDIGEEYLRSYKFAKEDSEDRFTNKQIMLLMFGIIAATVLLAFALAYFFG